tara:strand:+ start:322 stop:495 length:174 start_codon:yes stop_codon:yes gene_type:complete
VVLDQEDLIAPELAEMVAVMEQLVIVVVAVDLLIVDLAEVLLVEITHLHQEVLEVQV